MIAIFSGVNNKPGFDLREFEIIDGKPGKFTWLTISDYAGMLHEFPTFKAKVSCSTKQEFYDQFLEENNNPTLQNKSSNCIIKEPLVFTLYDLRGGWASDESKINIMNQINAKILEHYHGIKNPYTE